MRDDNAPGQAMVEFALVIGILLLIVIGGLKIGMAISNSQAMNNVADAGVFRVSVGDPEATVITYMQAELRKKAVNPDTVTMTITCQPAGCAYGSLATVVMTKTISIKAVMWRADFPIVARADAVVQKGP